MKNERLLDLIGNIDDGLVCGAAAHTAARRKTWLGWTALAACLALLVYAGVRLRPAAGPQDVPQNLPVLTLAQDPYMVAGMGFEGYMAFEAGELTDGNPWVEEETPGALPVFRNTRVHDENGVGPTPDLEAMRALLLEVAGRLGLDTGSLAVTDDAPSEEEIAAVMEKTGGELPPGFFDAGRVMAEQNGVSLEVDEWMTVTIQLEQPLSLPEGAALGENPTYAQCWAAAEALRESCRELLAMEDPQISVAGGDYDIYLHQSYTIEYFDGSGDMADQIVQFNFRRAVFYTNEEGEVYLARLYHSDLSERAGDYPIISSEEAKELLLNGNYITSAPYEMPSAEYIARVELVYRTGHRETYFMPYYRFLVEVPEAAPGDELEGLKTFCAYYVPAVSGEYLDEMPVWDGSFNG